MIPLVRRGSALLGLALLAASASGCGAEGGAELTAEPVDRVLVVSLPGVGWSDVRDADLPHLEEFLDHAAVGAISTRIRLDDAGATDAYLTLGAGTRAVSPDVDTAVAVDPDEIYRGVPGTEILERRLGHVPSGVAYLASGAATRINDHSSFGAEVGTLGDALEDAGIARAVIANADAAEGFVSTDPPPDGAYSRAAAAMLMDSDGIVPEGSVGRSLLSDDPDSPFGVRLDHDRVLEEFDQVWERGDRRVVLVEASDLSRALVYRPRATPSQRNVLWEDALADADALLGQLLERVDPAHDAVIVLSPVSSASSAGLGIAAASAAGVDPALLLSATTRRDGYVQLADVAPTVLSLLGEQTPDGIEGRLFQVGGTSGGDRVGQLADAGQAANFRDAMLPWLNSCIVAAVTALAVAGWARRRLPPKLRASLVPAALGMLGFVPATFLVGQIGAVQAATLGYLASVVAIAAVVALAGVVAERRWAGAGAVVGVGMIVGLIAVDVLIGAPLQVNTVFGYSVAIAGRFVGIGNFAFALLGAAAIVLAALIVDRLGRRGLGLAVGLLGGIVLLEGLPMLGADVGGTVAMIPAFGVTVLLLAGHRIGWREVGALGVATGAALILFSLVDAARPEGTRTHLVRFGKDVLDGRWNAVFTTLGRRWQASFGEAEVTGWVMVVVLMLAAYGYAALVMTGRGSGAWVREHHRPTVAAAAGLAVLGTLGTVANDSSFAVPATMLVVVVPALVLRWAHEDRIRFTATPVAMSATISPSAGAGGRS